MKHKPRTSRFNIKVTIVAGIVLFSLLMPTPASAILLGIDKMIGTAAIDLLMRLVNFIFSLFGFLVTAGAAFFEGMLNIGFKSHLNVVKVGWEVTRDFSNMFFILFLVVIAFATILRFEKYGIKQLLPKVILIALLINFSYVIAAIIIDFSNITAQFFIDGIENRLGGKNKIAATFTDSLKLTDVYFGTDCEIEYGKHLERCNKMDPVGKLACKGYAEKNKNECLEAMGLPTKPPTSWGTILSLLISATVGSMVLLVAAFTLFAGGILLLIRIIVLWFLVMIVPFVFLCYIMPALRQNWQKWWDTFLRWCFFAPAYAFFIWLAIEISIANKNKDLAAGVASSFVDAGPGANPFVSNPGQQLISYAFIIALLLGGLIAAKQMSFYGAKTAMKVGQRLAGVEKVKRYMAARKKVREEAKKEAVKRKLRLRETGGLRQAIKERMPGELGRRARARRADVIKTESDRMLKQYRFGDMRRVFGYRGLTGFRRTSRLAAGRAMAHPKYASQRKQMRQRELQRLGQRLARLLRRYGVKRPT